MDQRKGDARVYIVTGLFFTFIISGGVFLCLYIVLPATQSYEWYPIAGLVLVSIPWAFWFFTFIYRCFKFSNNNNDNNNQQPPTPPPMMNNMASSRRSSRGGGSTREPTTAATTTANTSASDSPTDKGGGCGGGNDHRRVQFGPVVVLGSDNNCGDNHHQGHGGAEVGENNRCDNNEHEHDVQENNNESEIPLRLSVS